MYEKLTKELFTFIENSPSTFHVVENMRKELLDNGYIQLLAGQKWSLKRGGKYFVIRNGSTIIAFRIPKKFYGFQIMASHSDSPTFKIKQNPEMGVEDHYVKLNIEKYGGMIYAPWFDRPLSIAGRLIVKEDDKIAVKLVDAGRDLVMIPNIAIHMNHDLNSSMKYSVQKDLLPLYGDGSAKGTFMKMMAEAADVKEEDIVGHDLYLYNRMKGTVWGANNEYISIGKLDDLQCAFASFKAFLESDTGESIPIHCVFDNEEVGSHTRQGAASTFLQDVLTRICECFDKNREAYRCLQANSFMLSMDNGHAVHPNYPEKACPTNRPYMNEGVVIKSCANQKYATDGVSTAMFRELCERAKIPYQLYLNHADVPGGSTLGNLATTQVGINTVDIGLAQLGMHSPYETAGIKDTVYLVEVAKEFYKSTVKEVGYNCYQIQ
ncbi:MAG: M18 family aminopeptidase [Schaedlerella sp.]|nr:M18 family aminopeptidase [Schaedlerella sp.]